VESEHYFKTSWQTDYYEWRFSGQDEFTSFMRSNRDNFVVGVYGTSNGSGPQIASVTGFDFLARWTKLCFSRMPSRLEVYRNKGIDSINYNDLCKFTRVKFNDSRSINL
jgi:hypothetical protein